MPLENRVEKILIEKKEEEEDEASFVAEFDTSRYYEDSLDVNGPAILSFIAFIALCGWTLWKIPTQSPLSACVFPPEVRDIFYGFLAILTPIIAIFSWIQTQARKQRVNKDRLEKRGQLAVPWILGFILIFAMVGVAFTTVMYGFSYKTVPMEVREGWVLHTCNTMDVVAFALTYFVLVILTFLPVFFGICDQRNSLY